MVRFCPLIRLVVITTVLADLNDDLGVFNNISVRSRQRILVSGWKLSMSCEFRVALSGLYNNTYHHRCSASGLAGATHLEPSDVQITESHVDWCVCCGRLVCCSLLGISSTNASPSPDPKTRSSPTNKCPESSETIVSAYRLTCVVSSFSGSYSSLPISCYNESDWDSFEANSAIICGQYMTASSTRSYSRETTANIKSSRLSLACLPSLRPILSFISAKFKQLRKHESTHKRGSKLLMDMLPAGKSPSSPVLPLSRKQSWNDGQHPMPDSSAVVEVEAMNPRTPELDAEAPGPHILEIGAQEPVLELECQRSIAELEGGSTSATRIR